MAYAKFEARLKEVERARAIYKFALSRMPRSKSINLFKAFTTFEKQYGDKDGIQDVILAKRRKHYEELLQDTPQDYNAWLDLARLEEEAGSGAERIQDVYERAIAHMPPSTEKRTWRRYIFIWLFYSIWAEQSQDIERTRQIYQACIRLIPHQANLHSQKSGSLSHTLRFVKASLVRLENSSANQSECVQKISSSRATLS